MLHNNTDYDNLILHMLHNDTDYDNLITYVTQWYWLYDITFILLYVTQWYWYYGITFILLYCSMILLLMINITLNNINTDYDITFILLYMLHNSIDT